MQRHRLHDQNKKEGKKFSIEFKFHVPKYKKTIMVNQIIKIKQNSPINKIKFKSHFSSKVVKINVLRRKF